MIPSFPIRKKFYSFFPFPLVLLAIILLNSSTIFCQPQWVKKSPLPIGGSLNSVFYIDSNSGWIVCNGGNIFKSTNGGYTYNQQLSGTSDNLKDVSFSDENNGWAVGVSNTIIHTTNGGENWGLQTSSLGGDLVRVKAVTSNIAYACGTNGLIKTADGGATWTNSISGESIVSLSAISSLVVWAASAHSVYKTIDGGANWTDETDPIFDGTNVVISFYDEMHGFLGTRYTTSFYTTDGGSTWNYASLTDADGYEDIVDFSFANNGIGWGIKDNQNGTNYVTVYKTTDYGADWTHIGLLGESEYLNKIFALDDDNVWTVGRNGLNAKWDNDLTTWEYIGIRNNYGVESFNDSTAIVFQSTGTGYHHDDGFAQVRTTNYGKSWYHNVTKIFGWDDVFFFLHQFIDENDGWIFANGPFFYTTDGGDNYSSILPSIIPENLSLNSASMFFVNSNVGWISTNGTVQQTTDGGSTWNLIYTIPGGDNYVSMSFITTNIGFGLMGTSVFKTIDGGSSWADIGLTNDKTLNKIEFVTSTTGFIIGNEGRLFRTSDSGNNWALISLTYTNDLSFLNFVDASNGWIGSSDGLIIQSTNGGDDWTNTNFPGNHIADMSFPSINYGYVVNGFDLYVYANSEISVPDAIEDEINSVQALPLNNGNKTALISKLQNALARYNESNFNAAKNILNAFINQLNQFVAEGKLTSAEAQSLIDYANQIIDTINSMLPKTVAQNNLMEIPKNYGLYQNYPNPFNPTTKIKYSVPVGTQRAVSVQLKVYNILGREIATLVNENQQPGSYEVEFNPLQYGLPSGVYFYELKSGGFLQTKKMILLR